MPGPTSNTTSPAVTPAAATMRLSVVSSVRKFWPSDLPCGQGGDGGIACLLAWAAGGLAHGGGGGRHAHADTAAQGCRLRMQVVYGFHPHAPVRLAAHFLALMFACLRFARVAPARLAPPPAGCHIHPISGTASLLSSEFEAFNIRPWGLPRPLAASKRPSGRLPTKRRRHSSCPPNMFMYRSLYSI